MKTKPKCRICGVKLTSENWAPSHQKKNYCLCKNCDAKRTKQWREMNPERAKASWTCYHRKQGQRPMSENKECAAFLGVYVAERVLSRLFKNIQRMPYGNPGFDFICGKGYRIDVKGVCKRKTQNKTLNDWVFTINHNTTADHFLCLAFDNREDLNPLHVWLIPGSKVNHLKSASISQSTIHKWDAYRLNIAKVAMCCNALRSEAV